MSRIKFPAGTSYHAAWVVRDEDSAYVNFSGYDVVFAVYYPTENQWGNPVAWLEKTLASGITLSDAIDGTVQVNFDPADTQDLAGIYAWELKYKSPSGESRLIDKGWLVLTPTRLQVTP